MENPLILQTFEFVGKQDPIKVIRNLSRNIVNEYVYSYCVKQMENAVVVNVFVSQEDKYNTMHKCQIAEEISEILEDVGEYCGVNKVIGFRQPDLDLMITLYEPLIQKLASEQYRNWKYYEYEDLCQICRLVIVTLYNKGYYIHKTLVKKCFERKLLEEIRRHRYDPAIVSIDDRLVSNEQSGDEILRIDDVLEDLQSKYDDEDLEEYKEMKRAFEKLKEYIIGKTSERQFEQLYRAYGTRNTDYLTVATVRRLKKQIQKDGITLKNFMEEK